MKIEYKDDEIVVRIPYKPGSGKNGTKSESGKSRTVASTKGFQPVEGCDEDIRINLNVISLIPRSER